MWRSFTFKWIPRSPGHRSSYHDVVRHFSVNFSPHLSAKRAKDLIKLVNSSSLTQSEKKRADWRADTKIPDWKRQKLALEEKLEGAIWSPKKKLSREEIGTVRMLKQQLPKLTATQLGAQFKVSAEVIRRILKSTWEPSEGEAVKLQARWKRRGERINAMSGPTLNATTSTNLPRKLVIGSGRSSSDIVLKRVKWKNTQHPDGPSTGPSKAKQKLKLLQKLTN